MIASVALGVLSSTDSTGSGSDGNSTGALTCAGSGSGGHVAYETALVFPILCVIIGITSHWLLNKVAPWMPYTPFLLIVGIVFKVIDATAPTYNKVADSIEMWENMDGHLLLFTFLPPLVFGDAMFLKWHTVSRCVWQCALLAVPGVLLGTSLFALVARYVLPYDGEDRWPWTLCFAFGSVMSATDPVAVVGLLNQLGAPESLTMIIGGESLLNDGSAMVIWTIFFNLYQGEYRDEDDNLDGSEITKRILRLALLSPIIGIVFGYIWRCWLGAFASGLDHTNGVTQTAMTIAGAYGCFYVAEGMLGASGVMAVVFMGAYLARTFWPVLADAELLRGTWHTLEWLYNTILFQLTGLIIGKQFIQLAGSCKDDDDLCTNLSDIGLEQDWAMLGWAFLLYLFALLIRGIVIATFLPLLQRMGYGLSKQGAFVAAWGGLRGAVGLALALVMNSSMRDPACGNPLNGLRIVVFTATTAILTLVVNAPTTGPIVRYLGMTRIPKVEQKALLNVKARVRRMAFDYFHDIRKDFKWDGHDEDKEWEQWVVRKVTPLGGGHAHHGQHGKGDGHGHDASLSVHLRADHKEPDHLMEASQPLSRTEKKKSLAKKGSHSSISSHSHREEEEAQEKKQSAATDEASLGALHGVAVQRKSLGAHDAGGLLGGIMHSVAESPVSGSGRGGKANLRMIAHKVQTSINIMDHRERIAFTRSMFCRHLKLIYDNLARSQLKGHPHLALNLRHSVDAAKDMVEKAHSTSFGDGPSADQDNTRLADLSVVMRVTPVNRFLLHIARNPTGLLAKIVGRYPKTLRQWVRKEAVKHLTIIMCFLTAHAEAQNRTKDILEIGSKDDWTREVNMVVRESHLSGMIAQEHLTKLEGLTLGDEEMSQLMRGLRARRSALELLARLTAFIHALGRDGALKPSEEEEMLHDLGHDTIELTKHSSPHLDGVGGGSLPGLPVATVSGFLLELDKLRKETMAELVEKGFGETIVNRFHFEKIRTELHEATARKEVVEQARKGDDLAEASHVANVATEANQVVVSAATEDPAGAADDAGATNGAGLIEVAAEVKV